MNEEQELLDLVAVWTFEVLDNSISFESFHQLENVLLASVKARESFVRSIQLHSDLIGMFNDAPTYLQRGLERAVELADYVQAETKRDAG